MPRSGAGFLFVALCVLQMTASAFARELRTQNDGPGPSAAGFLGAKAASQSDQATNFTLDGEISKHTPGELTLKTEENMIFHVKYDDKTEITAKDGGKGSPQDFRVGVKVHVEGDLTESGLIIAHKIQIH